ncbi:MAG: hypothetical protein SNJ60_02290 [Pseudanabaenaceae cyanobacterium]
MMVAPPSERWLREWSAAAAWSWGERYAHTVTDLTWREPVLAARVGTSVVRYVEIGFADGRPAVAKLDGQPTAVSRQKYALAVLIHWARHPEALTVRPSLNQAIATLSLPQAQQLLQDLAAELPAVAMFLEARLAALVDGRAPTPPVPTASVLASVPPDGEPEVLATAIAAEKGDPTVPSPEPDAELAQAAPGDWLPLETVLERLGAEDWEPVSVLLAAGQPTEALRWLELQGMPEAADGLLAEILLSMPQPTLPPDLVGDFPIARAAAAQGWHYEPLQAALAGNAGDNGAWGETVPPWADDLAQARLRILARADRWQEYVNLAQAEGQLVPYVLGLVRLGETARAIAVATEKLDTAAEALALAPPLAAVGLVAEAIALAEQGLTRQDHPRLARWLGDRYGAQNQWERALALYLQAFDQAPDLTLWEVLRPRVRPEHHHRLLAAVRERGDAGTRLAVFLHTEQWEAAKAIIDALPALAPIPLMEAVEQLAPHDPAWALTTAQARAEAIAQSGKSALYEEAIAWLTLVRSWQEPRIWTKYRQELLKTHGRKRKLVELMQALP